MKFHATKKRKPSTDTFIDVVRHMPHALSTLAENENNCVRVLPKEKQRWRSWPALKKREAKRKKLLRARVGRIQSFYKPRRLTKEYVRCEVMLGATRSDVKSLFRQEEMARRQEIVSAVCAGKL